MKKLESITLQILFFFYCFLLVLLIFEKNITIPFWLKPIGRMHPLILHFPITLIVLLVILNFFKTKIDIETYKQINRFLVLFTAFTTIIATIMGLFLSLESSTTNLMNLHKWFGIGLCCLIYFLVFIKKEYIYKTVLYIAFIGVLFTGHYGAGLTHGANFITEPLTKAEHKEITLDTPIYLGFIKPIIDTKCVGCHNPEKKKGDLDMSSFEKIKLGGKNGEIWVSENPNKSTLLKRAHLPLEHKEHMPPEGKKQLTKEEINLLTAWIKQGANEKLTINQLPKKDSLKALLTNKLKALQKKREFTYSFDFASKKTILALDNPYRTVLQKSPLSPAIEVVIYGRETYKPKFLTDLEKIKNQLVSLNLSYLPINKSSINFISTLKNLEELILNFTDINSNDLQALKSCKNLKVLSLSGTKVNYTITNLLEQLPTLEKVYLWNVSISQDEIIALISKNPNVVFETGFKGSEEKLQLTPPILISKKTVITKDDFVELGHKIPGVEIRYTINDSVPDENSSLYKTPIKIDLKNKKPIKTIAYKNNWLPSTVQNYSFVDKGYTPHTFNLVHQGLNSEFIGEAQNILIDTNKGNSGNAKSSPIWSTFNKENPLNAVAYFKEDAKKIEKIIFSYGIHKQQKKESLHFLEIWGSQGKDKWHLIKRITKPYNMVNKKLHRAKTIEVNVSNSGYPYFKIIAIPHEKEKLYVDQIFFY